MDRPNAKRQKVIEAVNRLSDDALSELSVFVDHLSEKSTQNDGENNAHGASFLRAIAGLGASGQTDISERDEEILSQEVDSISGWNLDSTHHS